MAFLRGERELTVPVELADAPEGDADGDPPPDLSDVYGQAGVKRALVEVATAGGHNVLTGCR